MAAQNGQDRQDGPGGVVRRYWDVVWNEGDLDAVDDLFGAEVTNHGKPEPGGGRTFAAIAGAWREGFPDLHVTVEEEVVEGATVVHRVRVEGTHSGVFRQPMLGGALEPTGRSMSAAQVHIHEVRDGRIVAHRAVRDDLSMFQQLGLVAGP